jgi:hypothetical protein
MTNVLLDLAFVGFVVVFVGCMISRRWRNVGAKEESEGQAAGHEPGLSAETVDAGDRPCQWTALDDAQLARHVREALS